MKKQYDITKNLIISKYFKEEKYEILEQYFLRKIYNELSVISLGFGGFFVVINPCSFNIEYSSDTFLNIEDVNLVEVEEFIARGSTVFRIIDFNNTPQFNFDYIKSNLDNSLHIEELEKYIDIGSHYNSQYSDITNIIKTDVNDIKFNAKSIFLSKYKNINNDSNKKVKTDIDIKTDIDNKKKQLDILNIEIEKVQQQINLVEKKIQQQRNTKISMEVQILSNNIDSCLNTLNSLLDNDFD